MLASGGSWGSAFEDTSKDETADADDLDNLMFELYEWADQSIGSTGFNGKKVCWIKTF